jgi:hypothetical protein
MGTKTPTITPTTVNTPTWSSEQFALINPTETATPEPTSTATPEGWEPTTEATTTVETEVVPEETTPTTEPTATEIPTVTPTPTVYTTKIYGKELGTYLDEVKLMESLGSKLRKYSVLIFSAQNCWKKSPKTCFLRKSRFG